MNYKKTIDLVAINYKMLFVVVFLSSIVACSKDEPEQAPSNVNKTSGDTLPGVATIARAYYNLTIIDIHNHDASGMKYKTSESVWGKYAIDRVVLFGDISEPSAQKTDGYAIDASKQDNKFIPFAAGINIFDTICLDYIKNRFAAGACGIGEIVAVSQNSPILAKLPWKGAHPLDGCLPRIYELCAQANKPILLHIDPPAGAPIDSLLCAAKRFPNTKFIFAHANAYSSPKAIESVLASCNNVYIDFFAGFTAYNPASQYKLADFVPVIKKYPNRFFLGSDSGYDVGYDNAYTAMYELFNLLPREIVVKIAAQNFLDITTSATK